MAIRHSAPASSAPPAPPAASAPPGRAWSTRRRWIVALAMGAALIAAFVIVVVAAGRADRAGPGIRYVVTAPRGERTTADLEVVSGAGTVTVRATDLGGDLYRVQTPTGGPLVPVVSEDNGRLQVRAVDGGRGGPSEITIDLSTAVQWTLRLGGGAAEERVDLRAGRLVSLDLAGGAGRIELSLPAPAGTVPVRISGAARDLVIHAAAGAPARLRLDHGSGSVTVDGVANPGVPPGTVLEPPQWAAATDRYDVEITGGVAVVTVDRG